MGSDTEVGLRAEIHRLKEVVDGYKATKRGVAIRITDLEDKVARLQEALAEEKEIAECRKVICDNQEAEIERLQKRCEVADRAPSGEEINAELLAACRAARMIITDARQHAECLYGPWAELIDKLSAAITRAERK